MFLFRCLRRFFSGDGGRGLTDFGRGVILQVFDWSLFDCSVSFLASLLAGAATVERSQVASNRCLWHRLPTGNTSPITEGPSAVGDRSVEARLLLLNLGLVLVDAEGVLGSSHGAGGAVDMRTDHIAVIEFEIPSKSHGLLRCTFTC